MLYEEPVVRLSGELDIESVPEAAELIHQAILRGVEGEVTVDLADVTFADSSALGMLLDAKKEAEAAGLEFTLLNPPHQLQRVLEVTKLDGVFDVEAEPERPSELA
jgi:anti-anti-sigma factor